MIVARLFQPSRTRGRDSHSPRTEQSRTIQEPGFYRKAETDVVPARIVVDAELKQERFANEYRIQRMPDSTDFAKIVLGTA
jgi:hypothetical protein